LFGPSEPALKPNRKDERGFECDSIGHLLCPAEWDWDDEQQVDLPGIIAI
jgi:hypothetical protein